MSQTAVGLFKDPSAADAVVSSLRAHGFPSNSVRIVSAPKNGMNGDFGTSFSKELRSMGATEAESGAYLSAVHGGGVLVYANGSMQQAEEAVGIMNQYAAIEIEEFEGVRKANGADVKTTDMGKMNPESRLPESKVTIGEHETSYTTHASRAKKEGARVFSW